MELAQLMHLNYREMKIYKNITEYSLLGPNSQLWALAEVSVQSNNQEKFNADFVSAWTKVTNANRFYI